jgi:hypothetical protein
VNTPKLTILATDTDAACDPETGICTVRQPPAGPDTRPQGSGDKQPLAEIDRLEPQ